MLLKSIQEGLKRDEYDKSLYLFAGKMALKNSIPTEAIGYLSEAIALDPEYMEAILVLMSVLAQQERYEDVIELYEHYKKMILNGTRSIPLLQMLMRI